MRNGDYWQNDLRSGKDCLLMAASQATNCFRK